MILIRLNSKNKVRYDNWKKRRREIVEESKLFYLLESKDWIVLVLCLY